MQNERSGAEENEARANGADTRGPGSFSRSRARERNMVHRTAARRSRENFPATLASDGDGADSRSKNYSFCIAEGHRAYQQRVEYSRVERARAHKKHGEGVR